MNKKLKLAFLASIIANVVLAGALLGQLSHRFEGPRSREERTARALEKLPDPARSRLREKLERMRKDMEPLREEMREARNEAIYALVAEPVDEAAHDRQIERINQLRTRMTARAVEIFKEAARELPPGQRGVLAEILRPASPRRSG